VFYLLNGGAPQPFASPLTLTDGQHEVLIRAADLAGNLSELSQTVKVDTISPHLEDALEGTLFDGWYAKTVTLSASASDTGSGLTGLDVSLDGGAWTPYGSPLTIGDGQHQAVIRARDLAGNVSLTAPLTFKVDARGPRIDLPENWNIWDTAAFAVRDGESGLSSVEVILSDPQGRWPAVKRTYTPTGSRYDGQIGWNRRFSDDTLAPVGNYRVTVKANDLAGNFTQKQATIIIPAGELTTEGTIVQPLVEAEDPPLETTFALPPEEPKAAPEPVETVFGGTSLAVLNEAWQANSLAAVPPLAEPPGILWGAGALAAMAAMTAYYQQKRREEEEARRAAVHAQFAAEQAEKERQQKAQAKVMAKLEKQWAEEKFKEQAYQQWKAEQEEAKAADALSAVAFGKKVLASPAPNISMPPGLPPEAQQAFLHGGSAAQQWIIEKAPDLIADHQDRLAVARATPMPIAATINLRGRPLELQQWTHELGYTTAEFCGTILQREAHGAWQNDNWFDGRSNDPGKIFTEAAVRWYWSWIKSDIIQRDYPHNYNNPADREQMMYNWIVPAMQSEDSVTRPLLKQYFDELKPDFTTICKEILFPSNPEWASGKSMWSWANAYLYNEEGRKIAAGNHMYKYGSGCTAWYIFDGPAVAELHPYKIREPDCK
jgi:hypothetical protein